MGTRPSPHEICKKVADALDAFKGGRFTFAVVKHLSGDLETLELDSADDSTGVTIVMKCIRCDNERFVEEPDAVIEQEFRGDLLKVRAPAMACAKCGWITVGLRQLDTLRRLTADAFRDKHGLLTSVQIKKFRCQLEMSQRDFATFLGVGEASVKRWETWLVQEKSSDQLIRLKSQKELSKRPAGEDDPPAWISCEHPVAEAADDIIIQESASAPGLNPAKWNLPAALSEPGNDTQPEADDDTSLTHAA